ncbi:cyclin-dependent kinase 9-like [Oratosquilla oratoria]|uniref:cyclin-dependent kinase 9-like n=1 Tax=Oratosquilla oratoria TaxID=337810 RepID=UPI003F77656A
MEHEEDFEEFEAFGEKEEAMDASWVIGPFCPELRASFEIGPLLGSGAFGWVHSAVFKSTGEKVAIKTQIEEISEEAIEKEIEALTTLGKHTNVISLHGVMKDVENMQVHLVIDLMDLSLEETLNRMTSLRVRFREDEVKSIWLQCLRGLRHIHMAGLVHGDLAARNVLLSRTGIVKISDFGMAVRGDEVVGST